MRVNRWPLHPCRYGEALDVGLCFTVYHALLTAAGWAIGRINIAMLALYITIEACPC